MLSSKVIRSRLHRLQAYQSNWCIRSYLEAVPLGGAKLKRTSSYAPTPWLLSCNRQPVRLRAICKVPCLRCICRQHSIAPESKPKCRTQLAMPHTYCALQADLHHALYAIIIASCSKLISDKPCHRFVHSREHS